MNIPVDGEMGCEIGIGLLDGSISCSWEEALPITIHHTHVQNVNIQLLARI